MRFGRSTALFFKGRGTLLVALVGLLTTLATAAVTWASAPTLRRITQSYDGGMPLTGANSSAPAMSADGRYVAFVSDALNFGPVLPGTENVFVKDRLTNSIELVNRTAGSQPSAGATNPALSADGRYVAFASSDGALVPGDVNGASDVFFRDRLLNTTVRVSNAPGGGMGNGPSGQAVAISGNGRYVAFTSGASNLVPGDTNDRLDAFVWDRDTGAVERVSPEATGVFEIPNLALNEDGRYVVFPGIAPARGASFTGFADLLVRDRLTHELEAVSVSSQEALANSGSDYPSISADGRFVVFSSNATNLATGGLPGNNNVYLRDRLDGTTSLVSYSVAQMPGFGMGDRGVISPDGSQVAFTSTGPMVSADEELNGNLYLRKLATGEVRRLNVSSGGAVADVRTESIARMALSADGRYVAFESYASNLDPADQSPGSDLFVRDVVGAATALVSVRADGVQGVVGADSGDAVISADGSTVAFRSNAHNLVPYDHNHAWDVFVTTRTGEAPELISVSTEGVQAQPPAEPFDYLGQALAISADGRFVAFVSAAPNLVGDDHNGTWDVFVRDRLLQTTVRADVANDGSEANGSIQRGGGRTVGISADGRYVTFGSQASNLVPGDSNGAPDIFVRDLVAQTTELISVATDGTQADASCAIPSISADGRLVSFMSGATNLAPGNSNGEQEVYVRDRLTQTTERVSLTSTGERVRGSIETPTLSGNGRYVAFVSNDPNVVPNDTNGVSDVFVRDLVAQTTERVSLGNNGAQLPTSSQAAAISADGRYVSFRGGLASWMVSLQLRDRLLNTTERLDVNGEASEGDFSFLLTANSGAISADGRYITFAVSNPGLDPLRAPGAKDVFVRTRSAAAVAPGSLTAVQENGQIRLSWVDRSDDETGFRIERRKGEEPYQGLITLGPGNTTYLDAAVELEVTYTYRVIALSPYGDSEPSNEASLDLPIPIPSAPTGLTATALSQTSVRLDWVDTSNLEAGFTVERSTDSGKTFTLAGTVATNQVTFTDTGLTANTAYRYRVKATNAWGSSPWSEAATVTTLPNPPGAPVGFSVSLVSDTELRLAWNSASHDEAGYRLERKQAGAAYQPLVVLAGGVTEFRDTGLQPSLTYNYRIQSFNAGGASEWVERSATTGDVPAGQLDVAMKLDFGTVKIGKTADRNLKIRNLSRTESLRAVLAVPKGSFSLVNPPTEVFLNRRGLRDTWIRFKPTAKGKKTFQLKLVSSDPRRPQVYITLIGRGK